MLEQLKSLAELIDLSLEMIGTYPPSRVVQEGDNDPYVSVNTNEVWVSIENKVTKDGFEIAGLYEFAIYTGKIVGYPPETVEVSLGRFDTLQDCAKHVAYYFLGQDLDSLYSKHQEDYIGDFPE